MIHNDQDNEKLPKKLDMETLQKHDPSLAEIVPGEPVKSQIQDSTPEPVSPTVGFGKGEHNISFNGKRKDDQTGKKT